MEIRNGFILLLLDSFNHPDFFGGELGMSGIINTNLISPRFKNCDVKYQTFKRICFRRIL